MAHFMTSRWAFWSSIQP